MTQNLGLVNNALSVVMRETISEQLKEKNEIIVKKNNKIKKLKKILNKIGYNPDHICATCEGHSKNGKDLFQCVDCWKIQHEFCDEMVRGDCNYCERECSRGNYIYHKNYWCSDCGKRNKSSSSESSSKDSNEESSENDND